MPEMRAPAILNACPRCAGDLLHDGYDRDLVCLQCGYRQVDPDAGPVADCPLPGGATWVLRRMDGSELGGKPLLTVEIRSRKITQGTGTAHELHFGCPYHCGLPVALTGSHAAGDYKGLSAYRCADRHTTYVWLDGKVGWA